MTQDAKEAILANIRRANATNPQPDAPERNYQIQDQREREQILSEFIDRLLDYKALITRCSDEELASVILATCQQHQITRLVVPADLPSLWIPEFITALRDDPPLTMSELDSSDGVLTGCALAIAQTGTIVLDSGARQGRRALTLVPDCHICIVYVEQVVGLVPEAITSLQQGRTRPITFIAGPSATSDIELNRVEGVHGPRTLHVLLVADTTQ